MNNIFVYTGTGAYQAKDIESFLAVFDYDYLRICQHEFDKLGPQDILIVPGGKISDYLNAWGSAGIKLIQDFVEHGGVYVGICAGAYVAGEKFEYVDSLGFAKTTFTRTTHHSIVNVKDRYDKSYQLIAENGPLFDAELPGNALLRDGEQRPQAIEIVNGLGRAILFAAHPEGSIYHQKPPQTFTGAVYFHYLLQTLVAPKTQKE